jgi:hypothetical protein
MIVGYRAIGVPVERYDAIHEVPDLFVVSMEDVGTILMDVYAFHIFAIDVAAQMGALVNDKAFLSLLGRFVSKGGSKKARPNY